MSEKKSNELLKIIIFELIIHIDLNFKSSLNSLGFVNILKSNCNVNSYKIRMYTNVQV